MSGRKRRGILENGKIAEPREKEGGLSEGQNKKERENKDEGTKASESFTFTILKPNKLSTTTDHGTQEAQLSPAEEKHGGFIARSGGRPGC